MTDALRLALDALLIVRNNSSVSAHQLELIGPAIEACRAALAAPAVPPGRHSRLGDFRYSVSWDQSGPIIERGKINLNLVGDVWEAGPWINRTTRRPHGPTPLIAACRCFVASKLGDDVDIPKELT